MREIIIPDTVLLKQLKLRQFDPSSDGSVGDLEMIDADGNILLRIPKRFIRFFINTVDIFSEEDYPVGKPIAITLDWLDSLPELRREKLYDGLRYYPVSNEGFMITTNEAATGFKLFVTRKDSDRLQEIEIKYQHELLTFYSQLEKTEP